MEYRKGAQISVISSKWTEGVRRGVTLSAIVIALFLATVPAKASVSTYFSPSMASFVVSASNGYRIAVERIRGRVSLSAFHGGKSFLASTSYTVRGKVSPRRIEASFGKFGRVSVRLKTQRMRRGKLEEQCTGKPETVRFGVFVGTIRFRGEGGYTKVAAQRAKGQLSSGQKLRCVFPNLRPGSRPMASGSRRVPPSLVASQSRHRIFAAEVSGGRRRSVLFSAASLERRGRMEIFRNVFADAPPASFVFASDLSSATVQPPEPFQGVASFQRASVGPAWSGSLSVDFPGRGGVRLAGPRFTANLARDSSGSTIFFRR